MILEMKNRPLTISNIDNWPELSRKGDLFSNLS